MKCIWFLAVFSVLMLTVSSIQSDELSEEEKESIGLFGAAFAPTIFTAASSETFLPTLPSPLSAIRWSGSNVETIGKP